MAYYHKLGEIPHKRHTQFRRPDGELYQEELVSSKGFSGIYSLLYHSEPPTRVKEIKDPVPFGPKLISDYALRQTHLKTSVIQNTGDDYLDARKMLLVNSDVALGICCPTSRNMDYFYKNAEGDEVIFVHDGNGVLYTQFGKLTVKQGDYVVIPRTTIYKFEWQEGPLRLLIIESAPQ